MCSTANTSVTAEGTFEAHTEQGDEVVVPEENHIDGMLMQYLSKSDVELPKDVEVNATDCASDSHDEDYKPSDSDSESNEEPTAPTDNEWSAEESAEESVEESAESEQGTSDGRVTDNT